MILTILVGLDLLTIYLKAGKGFIILFRKLFKFSVSTSLNENALEGIISYNINVEQLQGLKSIFL
jgi:hypothetical protein